MDSRIIIESSGAGVCLGVGLHVILQGCWLFGVLIIILWLMNMWVLFKSSEESRSLWRIIIASSGVGISIGASIYAIILGYRLFSLAVLSIGLLNLWNLVMEVKEG